METRKLSELKINPLNPRGEVVVDDSLRELAASIDAQGLLQPVLVTPDGTIVAGHRRVKATEILGLDSVLVIVKELNEAEQLAAMLIENLQREGLTTLQTARAYKALYDRDLSIAAIAKAVGYASASVSRHLDILKLPSELYTYFDSSKLPLGAIPILLKLKQDEQLRFGRAAAENSWCIADLEEKVGHHKISKTPDAHYKRRVDFALICDALERIDARIDNYPELRATQPLIRQAMRQIMEAQQQKTKGVKVA